MEEKIIEIGRNVTEALKVAKHWRSFLEGHWGRNLAIATRVLAIATLMLLPMLWGGYHPMAIGFLCIVTGVMFVLWYFSSALKGRVKLSSAKGLIFFIPLIAVALAQLCPFFFRLFASSSYKSLWESGKGLIETGIDLGAPVFAAVPDAQVEGIIVLVTVAVFYFLISQLFNSTRYALLLAFCVACVVGVNAFLGLCTRFGYAEWFNYVSGTVASVTQGGFFNRNHFAALCVMGFFVTLGLAIAVFAARRGSTLDTILTRRKRQILFSVLLGIAIIDFLAVIFSYSRGAIVSMGVGLTLFTIWILRTKGKGVLSGAVLVLIVGLFIASFYGFDQLSARFEKAVFDSDPSLLLRTQMWKTAFSVILVSPLFGSGFFGFKSLSQLFDTSYMPGFVSFDAHNDYLDLIIAFGIPVAAFVLLVGVVFLIRCVYDLRKEKAIRSSLYPIAVGLFIALIGMLLHEVMDYGLKKPANLCVFCAIAVSLVSLIRAMLRNEEGQDETFFGFKRIKLHRVSYFISAILFAFVVAGSLLVFIPKYEIGESIQRIADLDQSKELKKIMNAEEKAYDRIRNGERILAINPKREEGWIALVIGHRALAHNEETALLAASMSELLDRSVSTRQVRRATYSGYWTDAYNGIKPVDKEKLAQRYDAARDAACRLASLSPVNAGALSAYAFSIDQGSLLRGKLVDTVALHRMAMKISPSNVDIFKNAVRGFVVRLLALPAGEEKDALMAETLDVAKKIARLNPREMKWVMPLLWSVKQDFELLNPLTRDSIDASIEWAQLLLQRARGKEALVVLNRIWDLNANRQDEETPDTMGTVEFLLREKRSKEDVLFLVSTMWLEAYKLQDDEQGIRNATHQLNLIAWSKNTEKLARIDQLMQRGSWLLAEEAIKKLGNDPRALVRIADLALKQSRFSRFNRALKELEPMKDRFDSDTQLRYNDLLLEQEKLKRKEKR